LEQAQGFERWYEAHFDFVWRSLRRLGVPPSDVGDLTHDVFVVAWKRRGCVDPDRLKGWLFGVAFRIAKAHRRRVWFRRVDPEPDLQLVDPSVTPEQATLIRAELRRLQEAIDRVPLRQRAVLVLHDFEEVPVADAAAALGIPVKTAYSRLAAGRKHFRRSLRQAELAREASAQGEEP
jgi:RNA polymerase sigma-70 factor (ECF subfamily)